MKTRLLLFLFAVTVTIAARANSPVDRLEIHHLPVGAMLTWSCESSAVAGFNVERSTDGFNFEVISRLEAMGGDSESYNFLDTDRPSSKLYYRITSFDITGTSAQSVIAEAPARNRPNWLLAGGYSVEPNSNFDFEVEASAVTMLACELQDLVGKSIARHEFLVQPGINPLSVPVSALPQGAYRVEISGDEIVETLHFMKTSSRSAFEPMVRGN